MPIDPATTHRNNPDPFKDFPDDLPYEHDGAQQVCQHDLDWQKVRFGQVVVKAPNGNVLAAGTVDASDLQNGQSPEQEDPNLNNGGDFMCAVRWSAPPVARQSAYSIVFDGRTTVVNGAEAGSPIYLDA